MQSSWSFDGFAIWLLAKALALKQEGVKVILHVQNETLPTATLRVENSAAAGDLVVWDSGRISQTVLQLGLGGQFLFVSDDDQIKDVQYDDQFRHFFSYFKSD